MFERSARYRILETIGGGGEEYRARDTHAGRTVRIVVMPDAVMADADRRRQLFRDAEMRARLSHPNIAALYEIGEEQGRVFLAFEFVSGETLKAAMGGRPMNTRRALDLAAQIADALADAHACGIVARHVAPETIVITPRGRAKLVPIGLEAWLGGGSLAGAAAGNDVQAIGAVLFEMLTGAQPAGVPPSALNPVVTPRVDAIVGRALSANAGERYASAATLAADLRAAVAALDARRAAGERGRA